MSDLGKAVKPPGGGGGGGGGYAYCINRNISTWNHSKLENRAYSFNCEETVAMPPSKAHDVRVRWYLGQYVVLVRNGETIVCGK